MKKDNTASPARKKFSSGLMPKSTAGWLFLLVFTSAWMFFLGVLTGRGTAPVKFDIDKLQKELAALKESDLKEQISRIKINSDATKMTSGLGFYEELKDIKEQAKRGKSSKVNLTHRIEKPPSKDTISKKKQKSDQRKSQDTKASLKDTTVDFSAIQKSGKNLTIQAASFKAPNDADQMVSKLRKKGYPAYKIIGVVPGKGIWYRVRIGYYASKAEAVDTLKRLEQDGYTPYLVKR